VDLAAALFATPRHHFIPDQAWASGPRVWIDRHTDPDTWWRAVYADSAIVTQLDGGRTPLTPETAADFRHVPTCSASAPHLVTAALRYLDPAPGDAVLDIGTGTGWTAALLTRLVGDERVTTVDVSAELSAVAAANVAQAGAAPSVVVADALVDIPGEQFDRVHVTAGVERVPYTWIERTRPGGTIVLPYHPPIGRLLRLTVGEDGTATGTFQAEDCAFTPLRSPTSDGPRAEPASPSAGPERAPRAPVIDPAFLGDRPPVLDALLAARLGAVPWVRPDGAIEIFNGASRAVVRDGDVRQTGPRALWDEAEHTVRWWTDHGRPGLGSIGLTVTPESQFVWLGDPGTPLDTVLLSSSPTEGT
jgi:protein-L-isoaspartate(D-aspartate) O-methyltransferase